MGRGRIMIINNIYKEGDFVDFKTDRKFIPKNKRKTPIDPKELKTIKESDVR